MPFAGRSLDTVKAMRSACEADFSLDLHLRRPVVTKWIERAERHWRMAEQFADLHISYQSGMFMAQLCLETYLRAALIAQGVESRKCRDLQMLSDRLRYPIPGWTPDPETLNSLTQAALAYLDPCAGHPEPSHDGAWAIAHAGPLRDCLRGLTRLLERPSPFVTPAADQPQA